MNCPYKWANSIDEEDDQTTSWESELEGESAEELVVLAYEDQSHQVEKENRLTTSISLPCRR